MALMSLMGLYVSPFCYALLLLDFLAHSAVLQSVIKSVTVPWASLSMTMLLGVIIMYFFAIIGFVFFRNQYIGPSDFFECESMHACFMTTLNQGMRMGGGIGDYLIPVDIIHPQRGFRTFIDMIFFLIITVILMNIIFGIIIDTFADLRAQNEATEEDITGRCFICHIESNIFDRESAGFEPHIKNDHNMWEYLFVIVHLRLADPTDLNGIEQYVSILLEEGKIGWFPVHKALCLERGDEEDATVGRLNELQQEMGDNKKKMDKMFSLITGMSENLEKLMKDQKNQ